MPDCHVSGAAAGLRLLVRFDGELAGPAAVELAALHGVRIASLEAYRVQNRAIESGLVLGYGDLGDGEVDEAVARLATAVAEIRGARDRD